MEKTERGEHQRYEGGTRLDHAILQRSKLSETKEISPVRQGALEEQTEGPCVLFLGTSFQDVDNLPK